MNLPVTLRLRPWASAALFAAILIVLAHPLAAAAQPSSASAEERAARSSERAERRAQREQEREQRQRERQQRREERAANRGAGRQAQPSASEGEASGGEGELEGTHGEGALRGCRLSVEASATYVTAGEQVVISGHLTCPQPGAAADRSISLHVRANRHSLAALTTIEPLSTAADGSFTMTSQPLQTNTDFQVRSGRRGAHVSVKVAPLVTLTSAPVEASAAGVGSVSRHDTRPSTRFQGTVTPAREGSLVALQVAYAAEGERWHSVAWGHVGADGTYSIAHSLRIPAGASVRTIVRSGHQNAVGVSEALPVEGSLAQNPQLTIQTSADPVAFGQTLTISGVAAGAASAPVELLGRSGGGALKVLAQTTTEAGGAYSFQQSPLADTTYRVAAAGEQSAPLFEAVAFALTPAPAPAEATAGQPVSFSGTVEPAAAGQLVYLERGQAHGIGFHVIAAGKLESSAAYTISHVFTSDGPELLRLRVPGGDGHESSTSAPFTLLVSG